MLNRRKSLAVLGPVALGLNRPAQAQSRNSLNLDFSKPADNVYAIIKMQGDVSGKTMYPWGQGHIFGVEDNKMAVPMLRFQSCRVGEHRRRNDGAYTFRYRGMIFYQDFETGAFINTYVNPYTGEECEVRHFRTSIGEYAYTDKGTVSAREFTGETGHSYEDGYLLQWERAGDRVFVTLDERVRYQRPSDGAWRVDNAILRYESSWTELNDPDRTAATTSTSWQTQIQWFEWLNMGDRPGMHMQGGNGHKFMSMDDLPPDFVDFAEAMFPGAITDPITWDN